MPRGLSAEEADIVSRKARTPGSRPVLYSSLSDTEAEISSDFEVYLILTDSSVKTQIASFFQTIIDNNPNDLGTYNELLQEFIEEEIRNTNEGNTQFDALTSLYDSVRDSYGGTIDGFTDVGEVIGLQEAITQSLGSLAEKRDRLTFNYAALNVLLSRSDASGSTLFFRELESWIRLLMEYD
tara:strand:- start:1473 stop:2018 length:546 start_codon:yes stop_codon:yes gene_type:complete